MFKICAFFDYCKPISESSGSDGRLGWLTCVFFFLLVRESCVCCWANETLEAVACRMGEIRKSPMAEPSFLMGELTELFCCAGLTAVVYVVLLLDCWLRLLLWERGSVNLDRRLFALRFDWVLVSGSGACRGLGQEVCYAGGLRFS